MVRFLKLVMERSLEIEVRGTCQRGNEYVGATVLGVRGDVLGASKLLLRFFSVVVGGAVLDSLTEDYMKNNRGVWYKWLGAQYRGTTSYV